MDVSKFNFGQIVSYEQDIIVVSLHVVKKNMILKKAYIF